MWLFKHKTTPNTPTIDLYPTLSQRMNEMESRIRRLELNEKDMYDKVLRKLQHRTESINKDEEPINTAPSSKRRFGGGGN